MPRRKLDPLPSTAFHILVALAGRELHGFGILRAVEEQTSGSLRLGPGTLYGSLKTLLEAGMIEELVEREAADLAGERRRHYRLTDAGRKAAAEEAARLASALRVARAKRLLKGAHV
jgi:DNA-binding PadR family transcriptional regulator